jgi:hypothetical protein
LNEEIKKPDPDQSVVFELEAAIQFVKEHFESTIAKLDELPDDHRDFETLWTLFPPHCLVYSTDILGQEKVYRMRSSKYDRSEDGSVFFVLNMDYIDADGVHVGYVRSQSYQIPEYSGSTSLYDLPYYPLFHHTKFLVLWERMIARSNKILNLKGRHLQEYKGHALDEEGEKFNVGTHLPLNLAFQKMRVTFISNFTSMLSTDSNTYSRMAAS